MLKGEFLKQLEKTQKSTVEQYGLNTQDLTNLNNTMEKSPEPTIEEKRIAVVEKSVYIEGVRMIQKQERIGYFFTLIISLALVIMLFVVLRMV